MTIIPLLEDLFNGIIASINSVFGITIPATGYSFLRDLSTVWSGQLKNAYLYMANVQKNVWYDTADSINNGGTLERFGFSELRRLPYPAIAGQYICNVSGSAGAIIYANTTFLSDLTSQSPNNLFILDNDYTLTGSGDTILLRCTVGGTAANLIIGNTLTCTIPLSNINTNVDVASISVNSIDAETTEQYRNAIDIHVQLQPQGGAVSDYKIWASNVDGVRNVFTYTASGSMWQVNCYIEAILSDSGGSAPDYNYGIPTSTILTNSTNAILTDPITGLGRKPLGVILGPANVGALAVTVYQIVITFSGTGSMNASQKNAIILALQQAISNIRPFIAGSDKLLNQNDTISIGLPATGGQVVPPENYVLTIIAMNAAPGAIFTGIAMTVNSISETIYTFDNGIIPYLKSSNVIFT